MNIWILHPTAGGPGAGRHWRPYWLADAWKAMGHHATIVCASFHHLMQGNPRPAGHAQIGEIDYWFVRTPRYSNNNLGRLRNNFAFGRQFAVDAGEMADKFGLPDLIIASVPHLFHVSAARRIARRFRAKLWVEVRDLWPESIVAMGLASRWHPLVVLMAMQEHRTYRTAERVISLLASAEPYMRGRGLPAGRFVWIPNGISQSEIRQASEEPAVDHPLLRRVENLRAQGRQVVVYAGAMGPANTIEVILGAARYLIEDRASIHFIMVGEGVGRERLEAEASDLENLEFADEVERPIVHALLRASDCAVIAFRRNALYDHGISPNKLFDHCLFSPRSVIACEANALEAFEGLVGMRCEPDDPRMLASSLLAALAAPARPLKERIAAVGRFSYSLLAAQYLA